MNNVRRKARNEIAAQVEELMSALESLKDEEEEYRDNIPENLQGSERYDKADAACINLDSAYSGLEDVLSYIEEATA